jgi:hypothetical protein
VRLGNKTYMFCGFCVCVGSFVFALAQSGNYQRIVREGSVRIVGEGVRLSPSVWY